VLLLPVVPFKLRLLRYDCIVANFAKRLFLKQDKQQALTNFCSKFWILQPHMSKIWQLRFTRKFFYQAVLLTSVNESLGNIVSWDKNIFYKCCLST